jgi:hypothetical protein
MESKRGIESGDKFSSGSYFVSSFRDLSHIWAKLSVRGLPKTQEMAENREKTVSAWLTGSEGRSIDTEAAQPSARLG